MSGLRKCDMCEQPAENELSWRAIRDVKEGEISVSHKLCGVCAGLAWERIQRNPRAASSFQVKELLQ